MRFAYLVQLRYFTTESDFVTNKKAASQTLKRQPQAAMLRTILNYFFLFLESVVSVLPNFD